MTSPAEKERRERKEQRIGFGAAPAGYMNRRARRVAAKLGDLEAHEKLGLPLQIQDMKNLDEQRRRKALAKEK